MEALTTVLARPKGRGFAWRSRGFSRQAAAETMHRFTFVADQLTKWALHSLDFMFCQFVVALSSHVQAQFIREKRNTHMLGL